MVSKSDILVGIFWKRFGSATENYESGTLEEISQFVGSKKPFIIYFKKNSINIDDIQIEQLQKLRKFKGDIQLSGTYKEFTDKRQLREFIYQDISHCISLVAENNSQDNMNVLPQEKNKFPAFSSKEKEPENWYELSITEIINQYLRDNGISDILYKRELSFKENIRLWKSKSYDNYINAIKTAQDARKYAFDLKYGDYDYSKDLRKKYLKVWTEPIISILQKKLGNLKNISVVGVGANNGDELIEIFPNYKENNIKLTVVDISHKAITRGKSKYPDIIFKDGIMEDMTMCGSNSFDVYLNLRAVHSSGVSMNKTISECCRILKNGGIAVYSISNGYLTSSKNNKKQEEVEGMFDNRIDAFSKHKAYELAEILRRELYNYDIQPSRIIAGDTEVFVCGSLNNLTITD